MIDSPARTSKIFHVLLTLLFLAPSLLSAATINVPTGGNLQAAIDAAQPGDTIVLPAGARFEGSFILRYKPGASTDWITIRTSTPDTSLPPGERVTPADAPLLAKILSPGLAQPAIQTEPRAHHYRLIGLEIAPRDAQAFLYDVILLGTNGPEQDTFEEVPHHIVLDRCYIYAHPTQNLKRGIQLNSAHTDILDSYIAGFKVIGQEAQAIGGFNGPGPYKIINNYIEGAGENILFGGATASIPNLIPSDIEIRRNHFFKPLSWHVGDPSYAGYHWTVKNLFELKNARRVVIDGNIFENNWVDAQAGMAILFTIRSEDGAMPWATVEDVQFTNNILRNTPGAFNILGRDDGGPSQRASRITIRNNVLEDVSDRFLVVTDSADVTIDHNTVFHGGSITGAYGVPSDGFVFTNNLMAHNTYGFHGDSQSSGNGTLNAYFPGAVFRRNLIAGANPAFYPPDNFYPPLLDDARFVDRSGGNYRLAPDSPYRNQGTDGKDVGADIGVLEERTSGVRSGV
ncbi:MAG TPA: right-handed parallel beta-helix repeat-containing protein [Thermoanaerobaculia bacterium]|nr:right-handed parallel beta-helix repeat-containing protein [Thermoanaerobaculia bacterium]